MLWKLLWLTSMPEPISSRHRPQQNHLHQPTSPGLTQGPLLLDKITNKELEMSQEHNHIELSTWDRRRASSNPFTPQSHTAPHLADCVCKSIEGLNYSGSPLQLRAISSWIEAKLPKHSASEKLDAERLQIYLEVFDDMFFFGSLVKNCVVTITCARPENNSSAICRCFEYVGTKEGKGCVIKVWNDVSKVDEQKWDEMLSVLLHGMCHSFFMIYACKKDGCEMLSGDGNADVWQRVAKSVERAVWKQLGLELHLSGSQEFESLYKDCMNSVTFK